MLSRKESEIGKVEHTTVEINKVNNVYKWLKSLIINGPNKYS